MITPNFFNQFEICLKNNDNTHSPLPDFYDLVFKNMGPSLLSLSNTCTSYQIFLHDNYKAKSTKYRAVLKLIKLTYKENIKYYEDLKLEPRLAPYSSTVEKALFVLTQALTLIDSQAATRIANSMEGTKQCEAYVAIAKTCPDENVISRAIETSKSIIYLPEKHRLQTDVINILERCDKEKIPAIADLIINDIKNIKLFTIRDLQLITQYAHILYKTYPKKASEMITEVRACLQDSSKRAHNLVDLQILINLLPIDALFDTEEALKKVNTLPDDKMQRIVLTSIIDALAIHYPKKALEIAVNNFSENPPMGLDPVRSYITTLTLCKERGADPEIVAQLIEKAFSGLQDLINSEINNYPNKTDIPLVQERFKIELATILKISDRNRSLDMLTINTFVDSIKLEQRIQSKYNHILGIAQLLNDLNDERLITEFTKKTYTQLKDLVDNSDMVGGIKKDEVITGLAVSIAPFNTKFAIEMIDSMEIKYDQCLAITKLVLRVFEH